MKRFFGFFIVIFVIVGAFALISAEKTIPDKKFTIEEVAKFDGSGKNASFVVVDNVVYDVSIFKAWSGGKHKQGLTSGKDLTTFIDKAPHARKVLKLMPAVGTLKK